METSSKNGIKITVKEIDILTELLMKELLKLDGIEAEGEAKTQRRIEVDFKELKQATFRAKIYSNKQKVVFVAPTVLTTKWETFDSGVGSLNAPNDSQTSTKITKDWEQFD